MNCSLETPGPARQSEFLAAVRRSRALHGRWVKPPATEPQYRAFLDRAADGRNRAHFVCTPDSALAGVIIISEIVRGGFLSGYLGYYAFEPYAGSGCMRSGLEQVLRLAFREYGLHRLEANIQPGNSRSIELIRRLGFRHEGFSPRYLKIAGRWRDHERWAMTIEDWQLLNRPRRRPSSSARRRRTTATTKVAPA